MPFSYVYNLLLIQLYAIIVHSIGDCNEFISQDYEQTRSLSFNS